MTAVGWIFFLATAALMLGLPRRGAPFALIVGVCYMTLGQKIELGVVSLPVVRLLILIGVARVLIRSERIPGPMHRLDWAVIAFTATLMCAALLHKDPFAQFVGSSGIAFNVCGTYFLVRRWCTSSDDIVATLRALAIALLPVAVEMAYESQTGYNLFSALGGVAELSQVREGRIRAQGPFAHAILAGSVGATCVPLFIVLVQHTRPVAVMGLLAALTMVAASASSGPIGTVVAGLLGLLAWRMRAMMHMVRRAAIGLYVLLLFAMKAPPYFLLARLDVIGGSTGYYRAALISGAIAHFDEWWMWGTDRTAHWMPTGVPWSADHSDITNHYLQMGVSGGLVTLALFAWTLTCGFSAVGRAWRQPGVSNQDRYLTWVLGTALFAHAVTCISVSYFDQSIVILYLDLALIGALAPLHPPPTEATRRGRQTAPPVRRHHVSSRWHSSAGRIVGMGTSGASRLRTAATE